MKAPLGRPPWCPLTEAGPWESVSIAMSNNVWRWTRSVLKLRVLLSVSHSVSNLLAVRVSPDVPGGSSWVCFRAA